MEMHFAVPEQRWRTRRVSILVAISLSVLAVFLRAITELDETDLAATISSKRLRVIQSQAHVNVLIRFFCGNSMNNKHNL